MALFATMTFALTACRDDDDEPSSNSTLVGTWKSELASALGSTQYIQYQEDGTAIMVYIDNGEVEIEKSKWSVSGNVLTLNGYNFTIESLLSSKLVLTTLGITTTWRKVPDSEIEKYLK